MNEEIIFEQGEKVILGSTGFSFSTPWNLSNIFMEYVKRYKPINYIHSSFVMNCIIRSGYGTMYDLAKRHDLTWKIIRVVEVSYPSRGLFRNVYIMRSNQNHVLFITSEGITKKR